LKKKNLFIYLSFILVFISSVSGQIPTGYYDAAIGLSGDNLRTALKTITSNGHTKLSYSNIWNFYDSTDVHPPPQNTIIWDMYTDIPGGTPITILYFSIDQCGTSGSTEGICYSREHCVPNSWWGGFDDANHPQYSDLHHLFPADQYVNLHKSAHPIGQVGTPTYTSNNGSKLGPSSYPGYTGIVFEPINAYKGDFARAYLYMATRYKDSLAAWVKNFPATEAKYVIDTATGNYKQWFISILLSWHNSDPVSTKEINRNNVIYRTSQHNRNPFIDHPEYVQAIWGGPVVLKQEPSNYSSNFQATNTIPLNSTITVSWTDASGTVVPDGYLIRLSTTGFNQIQNPTDSIPEISGNTQKMVYQGIQSVSFTGLTPATLYYFKIFPFTNSGSNINYKTDGYTPTASDTTSDLLWKEDFETGSKTSYANDTVSCSMGDWIFFDALIGTSTSDRKNGLKSPRLRYANLRMNFDKTGGVDAITIYHAKYGNDANAVWKLQLSTDEGNNWNYVGNPVTSIDTILTPAVFSIKQPGSVRFNIETTSNTNRINIDDISITNYTGPLLPPPLLSNDTTNNNVDHTIAITFADNPQWRANITNIKIGNTALIPMTDYIINAGNIQFYPSASNALLTTAGSKFITIEAFGFTPDTIIQIINTGNPSLNSTVNINQAFALNSSANITSTARDQYNNLVAGYTFKYDINLINNDTSVNETYTVDGNAYSTSVFNINLSSVTNINGIAEFMVTIPAIVNPGDGLSMQLKTNNGTGNIGQLFQFSVMYPQTINFGTLTAMNYGDAAFNLNATASSGLTVSYSSSNTSVATISGSTLTIVGVGSTNISASQAGNAYYSSATNIIQSLVVYPKALSISGVTSYDKVYNGSNTAVITGTLSGILGSDIVFLNPSAIFTDINAATNIPVTSTSTISGSDAFKYTLIQPTGITANISKAPQTIIFNPLANKIITDPDFNPAASSPTSAINAITYSSSNTSVATIVSGQIHIVGAGTTIITASQAGSNNFMPASNVTQILTVTAPSGPIIAWQFGNPASLGNEITYNATYNDANLNISTLSRGNGINPSALVRAFSATSWDVSTTKANAINNNEYFEFSINPKTAYKVSLSSLNATLRRSSTGPIAYIWKYSTDGNTFSEIGTDVSFTSIADGVAQSQIDLSGITALQNVTNLTTLTFRIYAWGASNISATFAFARYPAGVTTNCLVIGGITYPIPPILSVSNLTDFGNQCINTTSNPSSFRITGANLTNSNVTIAAINGYTFSTTSGGSYSSTLSLPQNGGNFSQDIFVKFSPTLSQSYNGDIIVSGGGASSVNLSVSGSGINTIAGAVTAEATSVLGGQNVILSLAGNSGSITKWQKSDNGGILWDDVVSSANPYSEIPLNLGNWNYRAIVKNGSCPEAYANQATVSVYANTTIFTSAIDNNWNNGGNWSNGIPSKVFNVILPPAKLAVVNSNNNECNKLTISPLGKLSINTSYNLTVNDTLILESDSTGDASLIDKGILLTAANIVKRYIASPDQFHMLSSPVVSQSIGSIISASDSFYLWNEQNGSWLSYTDTSFIPANGGNIFIPGKAYAVSFPTVIDKCFTGALNKDTINIPLTHTSGIYSGWNFIANPYPSAINWNIASGYSRNMLEDAGSGESAIWIWNPIIGNYGTYISNNVSGTNGISNFIASNQGFWVKSATTSLLSINNNAREHSSQLWLKSEESTTELLRIKVKADSHSFSDETIINFGKMSDQKGAEKMFSIQELSPDLFTTKLNKNWSINFLTSTSEHPIVPLNFKSGQNGIYTLNFEGCDQFNTVILEDLQSGIQKDMKTNTVYQFSALSTDNPERFLIHFALNQNSIKTYDAASILIYSWDGNIYINTMENIREINIYNILGQQIINLSGNKNTIHRIQITDKSSYFIVKVVTDNNVYNKKLFVK